jgi:uncharacterized phage protein gp47/JayE
MPITNGQYVQRTEQEILSTLESELRDEFGTDIDLTDSSAFSAVAAALASVYSENQEQSLQDVYNSAFLETATGVNLDRVVSIIGIQRRSAINASGVLQFNGGEPVTEDRFVQRGTIAKTRSDDPVEFETTEPVALSLFGSFEDGSLSGYSGDVSEGSSVTDANAPNGDRVLQVTATDGAHLYHTDKRIQRGSTNHGWIKPSSDNIVGLTFCVDPTAPGDHYRVVADAVNSELRIERVAGGTVQNTIDTATGVSYNADTWHQIEFRPTITGSISATVYDDSETELATIGGEDHEYLSGSAGFISLDANSTKRFDFYSQSKVSANIRSVTGGVQGNVGANTVQALSSPPTGIEDVTNLYPVGDPQYVDTNRSTFNVGEDEETDEELRTRAENAVTGGGDATQDALLSALVNEITDVNSVTIFENKTDDDNTGTGGLPPHSFEAVVYGGDEQEIADTIFETKAVTARDYGGARGTEVTRTVVSEVNDQEFEIAFSRPTAINIDMTIDIVVDDTYVGDDELRDQIVRYIGGTLTEGDQVLGLDAGENVVIDQLQDIIVGPNETGVIAMDESVDGTPIETTPSSTTSNGVEVIDIGVAEVAQSDASDGSITINKQQI